MRLPIFLYLFLFHSLLLCRGILFALLTYLGAHICDKIIGSMLSIDIFPIILMCTHIHRIEYYQQLLGKNGCRQGKKEELRIKHYRNFASYCYYYY